MSLDELLSVCVPPATPVYVPTAAEWRELETAVGQALPSDYKAFLARFGSGAFGCDQEDEDGPGFFDLLWVLSPGHPPDVHGMNAIPLMKDITAKTGEMRRRFPHLVPHPAWPDAGGLLYVGGTTTQHDIYWKTNGDEADAWTCVMCDRGCDHWFDFPGDLTSLMAAAVTRRVPDWILEGPKKFPLMFRDIETLRRVPLL